VVGMLCRTVRHVSSPWVNSNTSFMELETVRCNERYFVCRKENLIMMTLTTNGS